jgi:hypothetical protein
MLRILAAAHDVMRDADTAEWVDRAAGTRAVWPGLGRRGAGAGLAASSSEPPASVPQFVPKSSADYTAELRTEQLLHTSNAQSRTRSTDAHEWSSNDRAPADLFAELLTSPNEPVLRR